MEPTQQLAQTVNVIIHVILGWGFGGIIGLAIAIGATEGISSAQAWLHNRKVTITSEEV